MLADPRKGYILNNTKLIFRLDEAPKHLLKDPILLSFISSPDTPLIKACLFDKEVRFYGPYDTPPSSQQAIYFMKNTEITEENMTRTIHISSNMPVDPLLALKVQINLIKKACQNPDEVLKALFEDLSSNFKGFDAKKTNISESPSNSQYPNTISEEIEYWNVESANSQEKVSKKAQAISEKYSRISKPWKENLKNVEISGLKDLLAITLEILDGIYNENSHKEAHFKRIIELFSAVLIQKIQQELCEDIWEVNKQKIIESSKSLRVWKEKIEENVTNWREISENWRGFEDLQANFLLIRVNEILEIRNQIEEISRIYQEKSPNPKILTLLKEALSPLRSGNWLEEPNKTAAIWTSSKRNFFKNLEPLESEISQLLKQEFFISTDFSQNPYQTLKDLLKYQGLLSRQNILNLISNERGQLLDSLFLYSNRLKEEFEARTGQLLDNLSGNDTIPQGHNFSKVVNSIIWVQQLSGKLKRLLTISTNFLEDLKPFQELKENIEQITKNMLEFEQEQFESWRKEILDLLSDKDNTLALQLSGKLMEFDLKDGLLTINYSERLVLLLREVRQLAELGFRKLIPAKIIDTVELGKRFYKEALTLKQIAHFYNNMSSQIISSQKPMILEQAMKFEEVVLNYEKNSSKKDQNPNLTNTISWENASDLEKYITRVQEASNELISENRKLRKVHINVCEILNDLFEVDLLKNRDNWREKLEQAKRLIDIAVNSRDQKLCKTWKTHWDYQLYKILEFQYQSGLLSLNQDLSEISAEIILSGNILTFRPSLEDLKQRYYRELTNFINFPSKHFVGIGSGVEIFKEMPQRSAFLLGIVYRKAEELFQRLVGILNGLLPWARISYLQLEDLETRLKSLEDWEFNFKNIRAKRKELERLPESYKVDCFTISAISLKNKIDDILQFLLENLVSSLRISIRKETQEIEDFVTNSLQKLSQKPKTMEEITKSKEAYLQLKEKQKLFQIVIKNIDEKLKLVRNLAGGSIPSNGNMLKQWENFEFSIADYDNVLLEQQQEIKSEILRRSDVVSQEIERFYTRWTALRPKKLQELSVEEAKEVCQKVKEWRVSWGEIEQKVQELYKDIEVFSLEKPAFKFYEELKQDIVEEERAWELYEAFQQDLEGFEKEDWVSFRLKLFNFQDIILIKWMDKLQKLNYKDLITGFIQSQIELYKQIWPILKLLIGEAFERDHWKTLFNFLEMPKTMTLEKLTFGNLIEHPEKIIKKTNDIKDLALRAQGEVSLREAIQELKVWCETTEFEMTEYQANNRMTPLIKEWKDLMTKVSDNQALLASLKESKFYAKFTDQIEQFENKMGGIDDYLNKLNIIQRKWVYLEPIFSRGALPMEQNRFKRLDDEYRSIMLNLHKERKVVSLVSIPGVKDSLEMIVDQLDRCQKALNDYLEEKRTRFSRFYFLGDDDLLEILGQSKNVLVIQMHLKKLYAGIHSVEFKENNTMISAIKSSSDEKVPLIEHLAVEEEVENWLGKLTVNMQRTLQQLLISCLKEKSLELLKYPAQVICLAESIRFSQICSSSITSGKLMSYKQDLNSRLQDLTALTRSATPLNTFKLKSLILDVIHSIDVLDQLISQNVQNLHDWAWIKQLRFDMNNSSQLAEIIMVNAQFAYTYEYQGNAQKLVHTPLTDKCYLTLTQGMSMGYGGNPYGPAGTGKTESVKALGQAFGRQVLVFNCDEGIDFKSMGRIFIGIFFFFYLKFYFS